MSYGLPDDWYEEHDGRRLVLNAERVAAEVARLRYAITTVLDKFKKDEADGYRSRDRQYAIEILGTLGLGESPTRPVPADPLNCRDAKP